MTKRAANGTGCVFQPTYTDKGVLKTSTTWWMKLPNGTKEKCVGATSEREARVCLQKRLGQEALGLAPKTGEKSLTYGDLREDLLRYFRVNKLKSLDTLSDGTETVKGLTKLDEFFKYSLTSGGMKVSEITPQMWDDEFITARRKEGVSDGTIINSAKLLRQMFSLAVKNNRLNKATTFTIPTPPEPKEHCLRKEQYDQLLRPRGMSKEFHPLLTFLFYQGTRINEALSITWGQIRDGAYYPKAANTKTGDDKPKPLQKNVIEVLGREGDKGELVFGDVRSEGENPSRRFADDFRNAMLRLGFGKSMWECAQCKTTKAGAAPKADDAAIPCPQCKDVPMQFHYVGPSPHSLRASCVVFYLESGMTETEIMKVTGHNNIKVFRGYARLPEAGLQLSMNAAEEMREKRMKELEKATKRRKPAA